MNKRETLIGGFMEAGAPADEAARIVDTAVTLAGEAHAALLPLLAYDGEQVNAVVFLAAQLLNESINAMVMSMHAAARSNGSHVVEVVA